MINPQPAPQAGSTITADIGNGPEPIRVEDWWDRVSGGSWTVADGSPAAIYYAARRSQSGLPIDNQVLYGKDSHGFGHLLHVSEVQS